MTTFEAIEKAILQLSAEELARLRDWLDEFEGRLLDTMIERAAGAGGQRGRPRCGPDAASGCRRRPPVMRHPAARASLTVGTERS
jgi:hypothetical protein